ncbi:hypothetical protein BC008_28550 [Mastigocoleus testarum BC008]|uniref:Uncharacterized protein n=1 Tax=Mastigocoleus testarum BC008 TaxID=371196 RepID=A0A0V7ZQP4_9CYAN|nr:hypothetical protein BC008_27630 [Mastigocoleus testarum BC008]KST67146.1 hypothetical protein BC008_28550 [Mastigocoleus testarum BC008]
MINLNVRIPKTIQPKEYKILNICAKSLRLTKSQSQIFICTEQANRKICLKRIGLEFWGNLKKQVDKLRYGQHRYTRSYCMGISKSEWLQVYLWGSSQNNLL